MSLLSALLFTLPAFAQARLITPEYQGNCQGPLWARDGSKLAYEVNYHNQKSIDLFVYEPGREARKVLASSRGSGQLTSGFSQGNPTSVVHEPAWGPPEVDRFVFSASNHRMDFDIFLERAGAVAAAPGADGEPTWSESGRWLVFTSARTGQGDLYLLDLFNAGSAPVRLTKDEDSAELDATFSPEGNRLLYVAHNQSGDNLYLIDNLSNPVPQQLTHWSRSQASPSWSPDGQRIAFYSNHDFADRNDLYVMTPGSQPYPVAQGVVKSQNGPSWTPDGQSLVFVQDQDQLFDPVYIVSATNPDHPERVPTQTVGNSDLDVVRGTDGLTWLAVSAQGLIDDQTRDFKRIYVMTLP